MKRSVQWLVLAVVLAMLGWYVYGARAEFERLFAGWRPRVADLAPIVVIALIQPAVNGWIGRKLAGEFGVRLSAVEAFSLAMVNALGNYLPIPQAGAVARGAYLRRVHRLPWGTYAASLLVTYVTAAALYGVVGMTALAVLAAARGVWPWQLWLIFGVFAGSLVLFTPASRWVPLPGRLAGFRSAVTTLGRHHVLWHIIVLQLVMIALASTGIWAACRALPGGEGVSWFMGLLIALTIMASGVTNLTPGNLGVEQAAAMLTTNLLGVDPKIGLLASALYRAVAMGVVFTIGPVLTGWLARRQPRETSVEGAAATVPVVAPLPPVVHGGTPGWKR